MRPFTKIVTPHPDVLESSANIEKYAASLYKVHAGIAPLEYRDAERFADLTYKTSNMVQILDDVEDKLKHGNGNAFMHIETPFGGGKTHAMIASYHKAKQLGVKTVVIDGVELSADVTIWGLIEEQLEGKVTMMAGETAPGGIKIRELLEKHQPVLILIDELVEYMSKAAGRIVGDSTLSAQTSTFIQELTSEVANLDNVCVIASFLASTNEFTVSKKHKADLDKMLRTIDRLAGRQDYKITPISPDEVPNIIRRRLFVTSEKNIKDKAKDTVIEYAEFCAKNNMLPTGTSERQYAEKFMRSYPFQPDVIDVLYERWGTLRSFQRTRGVLRLLAMVVNDLKDSGKPYITLADFNLSNDSIRQELIQHIGRGMNGVITSDITKSTSTSSNVKHGQRCATTMFMHSFDQDGGKGATANEIKRSVSGEDVLPPDVGDSIERLKTKMYYMRERNGAYKFTSEPNINRMKDDIDVPPDKLDEEEKRTLAKHCGTRIRTYVWPQNTSDVDDSHNIKLVILAEDDKEAAKQFMWKSGDTPRSNKNTVLVLCHADTWSEVRALLRKMIILRKILESNSNLPKDDINSLKIELRNYEGDVPCMLLNSYKILYVPGKNGPEQFQMPIFTIDSGKISDIVYDRILGEAIHEKLAPAILKKMYLENNETVHTNNIFGSMMRDPGSRRPVSEDVIYDAIVAGVEKKLFGLGTEIDTGTDCQYFGRRPDVSFAEDEVLIKDPKIVEPTEHEPEKPESEGTSGGSEPPTKDPPVSEPSRTIGAVSIRLKVKTGHAKSLSEILRIMQTKNFNVNVTVDCADGELEQDDLESIKDSVHDMDPFGTVSTN